MWEGQIITVVILRDQNDQKRGRSLETENNYKARFRFIATMADSPSKKKSKDGGKPRGKDRERSRSPARLRASRGAKKKSSTAEMTLEEMVRNNYVHSSCEFFSERLK